MIKKVGPKLEIILKSWPLHSIGKIKYKSCTRMCCHICCGTDPHFLIRRGVNKNVWSWSINKNVWAKHVTRSSRNGTKLSEQEWVASASVSHVLVQVACSAENTLKRNGEKTLKDILSTQET